MKPREQGIENWPSPSSAILDIRSRELPVSVRRKSKLASGANLGSDDKSVTILIPHESTVHHPQKFFPLFSLTLASAPLLLDSSTSVPHSPQPLPTLPWPDFPLSGVSIFDPFLDDHVYPIRATRTELLTLGSIEDPPGPDIRRLLTEFGPSWSSAVDIPFCLTSWQEE